MNHWSLTLSIAITISIHLYITTREVRELPSTVATLGGGRAPFGAMDCGCCAGSSGSVSDGTNEATVEKETFIGVPSFIVATVNDIN